MEINTTRPQRHVAQHVFDLLGRIDSKILSNKF